MRESTRFGTTGIYRIFVRLLIAALLFTCVIGMATGVQAAEKKVVRVGYDGRLKSTPEGDVPYGYGYDSYQKLADYTGWEYEYVYASFSDVLEKLKTGEIDVYLELTYNEERAEYLYYSTIPQGMAQYYLMTDKNNSELETIADIAGKKVGVLRGSVAESAFREYLTENHIDCEVVPYDKDEDALKNLEAHSIDAVFSFPNNVTSNKYVRLKFVGPSIASNPFYFVVSKHRPDLYRELEIALEKLDVNEPHVLDDIYNRYATESSEVPVDAQDWLDTHDVFRVGYVDTQAPYLIDTNTDKPAGIYMDVLEQLARKYKLSLNMVRYADMESMSEALKAEEIDFFAPALEDNRVAEKFYYALTETITNNSYWMFYVKNADPAKASIAIPATDAVQHHILESEFPDAKLTVYDTVKDCIDAVKKGQADCMFMAEAFYLYGYARHADLYNQLQMVQYGSLQYNLGLGVKKGNASLLALLNHGINTLDAGILQSSIIQNTGYQAPFSFKTIIQQNPVMAVLVFAAILGVLLLLFLLYVRSSQSARIAQERAIEAERKANQAKTEFLSRMSHDIRTPINGILGMAHIMEVEINNREVVKDSIGKIQDLSNQLEILINEVLEMSRIESGKVQLSSETMNLDSLSSRYRLALQVLAEEKGVTLHRGNYDIVHKNIICSPVHLQRILMNIATNAIKYNREGGEVCTSIREVPVDETHSRYIISIEDTGIGMSEEFLKHMYEPFAREDQAISTHYTGTGLGMGIAKELTELMGGSIAVESEKGKGTRVTIDIPFAISDKEEADETLGENFSIEGKHILLVEDNELNLEVAKFLLEEEYATVDVAANGREGVQKFEQSKPGDYDLILMDLMMPEMNGYDAVKAIRKLNRPDAAAVVIIAMSANAFKEDVDMCLAAGMNDHIAKPVNIDEMKKIISRHI